jgi:hypothetical protein
VEFVLLLCSIFIRSLIVFWTLCCLCFSIYGF